MTLVLNKAGERHASQLIANGDDNDSDPWSFDASDEDALLGEGGDNWDAYTKWFLGEDTDATERTKERFKYPFGKNGKVYRSALRAIRSRSAQQNDTDVYDAAGRLMDEMNQKSEDGKKTSQEGLETRDIVAPRLCYRAASVQLVPGTINHAERTIDCIFSTETPVQRSSWSDGDYVEVLKHDPKSVRLDRMNKGAAMLDSHDYYSGLRAMIGAVVPGSARIENRQLAGTVRFSRNPGGDAAFQDACDGILTGLSVGYATHKVEIDDTQTPSVHTVTDWEPYEVSGCPMPADVVAGFRSAQPHGSTRGTPPAISERETTTMKETTAPAGAVAAELDANTRSAIQAGVQFGIKAEQERRDGIADIAKKLGLADELAAEHVRKETPLDAFRTLAIDEAAKLDRASPQTDASNPFASNPNVIRGGIKRDPEKGEMAARMLRCLAFAKRSGFSPLDISGRMWGDPLLTRAMAAGVGASGGFLVPEQYAAEVIEFLRPASAVRKLNPIILPMPGGNTSMPRLASGANAGYVGENKPIVGQDLGTAQVKFSAKKLAALVPISNDLLAFASPQADQVVRDDMVTAIAQAEDVAFIRGSGTEYTPRGMRNAAPSSNVIAANGTVSATNTNDDLKKLQNALTNSNCRMLRPGWMFAWRSRNYLYNLQNANNQYIYRDEMNQGKLNGFAYAVTNNIPINLGSGSDSEIYLTDFADAVIAEVPGLRIDVSNEAAYNTDSNTVVSAFSNDQTVIRVIEEHDFNMRHDPSTAVLTGVTWS
ncbi:MAG TPA: phage major capsid protein [Rhizomicrobium sp.]|jgi:HK97 family phage major capsid protein/HK97 family phage prohead protease